MLEIGQDRLQSWVSLLSCCDFPVWNKVMNGRKVPTQVVGWHFGPFLVVNFEVIMHHGFLDTVKCFGVHFTQVFHRLVIGEQQEPATFEMMRKIFHTPDSSVHFQ